MSVELVCGELRAVFLPERGMTLAHLCRGEVEAIDQTTRGEFEKRSAGLGCLIGPHFYRQKPEWVAPVRQPELFPHLAFMQDDPFSHGIGRYAPWGWRREGEKIVAELKGSDRWRGCLLKELEGTDFVMRMEVELKEEGLCLEMQVEAERLSVIGLHYYYALPGGAARVRSKVQPLYNEGELSFDLEQAVDDRYLPENGRSGEVLLETRTHRLKVCYQGEPDAVSWQLYHPQEASFVCIEPMSVKNPRGLNTTKSSLAVQIDVRALLAST